MNYRSVHVSQAEIATLEAERKSLVIDPQHVQHRGMQIMDVEHVFDGVVAKVVRGPIADTLASHRHPPSTSKSP